MIVVGQARAIVRGGAGNDDVRALAGRPEGSALSGGAGNDVLRGSRGNDILGGGPGDDQLYGGDGADQFHFSGSELTARPSIDRVYDLSFSKGDILLFRDFTPHTFAAAPGIQALDDGSGAVISSWAGLVHATRGSELVRAGRASPYNDNLVVRLIKDSGQVQEVVVSGGWPGYVAAGGLGSQRTSERELPVQSELLACAEAFGSPVVESRPAATAADLCCCAVLLGLALFRRG